jgi:hypothetical protein
MPKINKNIPTMVTPALCCKTYFSFSHHFSIKLSDMRTGEIIVDRRTSEIFFDRRTSVIILDRRTGGTGD